ncbi:MAG: ATP-binding protein [Deltaproteobacteria bacterium]|nr:ATP-binding protein [Deltaproteobacteria bacterium]
MPPLLIILCGNVGSGKSSFARQLESHGVIRLSIDEQALHDAREHRDPSNFFRFTDISNLRSAEQRARSENLGRIEKYLRNGQSVVLDDGFWQKEERERYAALAREFGAEPILFYFPIDAETQWSRLVTRNSGDLTSTHYISREDMEYLNQFVQPPSGEGEHNVETLGVDRALRIVLGRMKSEAPAA